MRARSGRGRIALATLVSVALVACSPVSSSVIRTGTSSGAYTGRVTVAATWVPQGARELGIVQATGAGVPIERITPEFIQRVAELGGDFGKIDHIRTRFEMQTQTSQQSYNCGTAQAPRTCSRMVTQTVEVAITLIEGRAFTTRDLPRRTATTPTPGNTPPARPWPSNASPGNQSQRATPDDNGLMPSADAPRP